MKVVVAGGTGFVGTALVASLKEAGHEITIVSRSQGPGRITWDELSNNGLPECDAVVNLAGQNILDPNKTWGDEFKQDLRRSHLRTTKTLADKIAEAANPPKVFVSSSATGYYPPSETVEYTEDSPQGTPDFLAGFCKEWEDHAKLPDTCKTRLVIIRIGVVLGRNGGIIQQTIWPFWLGLGGRLGSGKQAFPWVHMDDMVGIITHALMNDHVTGPLNCAAPEMITNEQFTKAYGSILWRPTLIPVPAFLLNYIFGAERATILLEGQKVIPKRTLEMGYKFKFTEIKAALKDILC